MDAATINSKIYAGRGKAALRIGYDCNVYRPTIAANPFSNGVRLVMKAAFNSGDSTYTKPNLYGDPVWFGDFDGRLTKTGDYIVRIFDGQVFFIAQQQPILPIVCIDCGRSLKLMRPNLQGGVGAVGYGGATEDNMTDALGTSGSLSTYWPCSIVLGGRSQNINALPLDVKQSGVRILLPPSVPISLRPSDIFTDDLGRRYSVEAAELSDLGWRINAQEVHS